MVKAQNTRDIVIDKGAAFSFCSNQWDLPRSSLVSKPGLDNCYTASVASFFVNATSTWTTNFSIFLVNVIDMDGSTWQTMSMTLPMLTASLRGVAIWFLSNWIQLWCDWMCAARKEAVLWMFSLQHLRVFYTLRWPQTNWNHAMTLTKCHWSSDMTLVLSDLSHQIMFAARDWGGLLSGVFVQSWHCGKHWPSTWNSSPRWNLRRKSCLPLSTRNRWHWTKVPL